MNWRWNFLEKLRFDYEGELLNRRGRGSFYEDVCVEYLCENGFTIIKRNYRCKLGEIDIVAMKDNIIRFIEKADGPVYQKTICQEFQLSHSTVVGIVFRLDDLGYLLIGNSRVDKRHTNVTITEKGKQLIQETEDIYQEIIGKMKVIISDEEMNTIIQSVDQIKELFK